MIDRIAERDFTQADDLVRGRQIRKRHAVHASDVLSKLLSRKGYTQQQSRTQLHEAWNLAADQSFVGDTRVGNLNRGVLEIIVSNSAVCQQLNFMKRSLLANLSQRLPQEKIRDLKFRVGPVQ